MCIFGATLRQLQDLGFRAAMVEPSAVVTLTRLEAQRLVHWPSEPDGVKERLGIATQRVQRVPQAGDKDLCFKLLRQETPEVSKRYTAA